MTKHCNRCQTTKDTVAFYKNKTCKDGFTCYCRRCYDDAAKTKKAVCGQCCIEFPIRPTDLKKQTTHFCSHKCQMIFYNKFRGSQDVSKEKKLLAVGRVFEYLEKNPSARQSVCSLCNSTHFVEAHHPDYDKWDEVVWVCRKCHKLIHSGMGYKMDKLVILTEPTLILDSLDQSTSPEL